MSPFSQFVNNMLARHRHTLWCSGCGGEITLDKGEGARLEAWLLEHWYCIGGIRDTSESRYRQIVDDLMVEAEKVLGR